MCAASVPSSEWFPEGLLEDVARASGDTPDITGARRRAFHAFRELPAELDPLYRKYSHLSGIDLTHVAPAAVGAAVRAPNPGPGEVVIVHDAAGTHLAPSPELVVAGLKVLDLPQIWGQKEGTPSGFVADLERLRGEKFGAMNAALFNRGYFLDVPDRFPLPVRLRELSILSDPEGALIIHRHLHTGSESHLFHSEEVYTTGEGPSQRLYSSSTSLSLGAGSVVTSLAAHSPGGNTVSFYDRYAETSQDSSLTWLFSGLDGFRTSLRNTTLLKSRGSEVSDYQIYLGDGTQSTTSFINVVHEADDTRGQSLTRGVFKEESRGTLRGMMRIEPHVRKIFSNLSEHSILLSKSAKADTLPMMEILSAADVKATHSTSVAPLDQERLFYVESRGVETARATRLIAEGFLANILLKAPIEGLEEALSRILDVRWSGRHLAWDGVGPYGALLPHGSTWRTSGEVRMDAKLR